MENYKFHKNFKLNNNSFFNVDELLTFAASFSVEIHQFLEDWFSENNFITVQTSGSTGKPKSIQLKKQLMQNSAFATGEYFNLKENTRALLCLPIQYIAGKMMLVRALTLGWNLDAVAPNSYPLKDIEKEYDFSAMVPLQVENSISQLYFIKKLIVGGGVVSNQLQNKLQNSTTEVFATYGMTETITHIAAKKLNNFLSLQERITKKSFKTRSIKKTDYFVPRNSAFYQTLPNVTIYKDERNCLVIDAKNVAEQVIFTNDVVNLISDTQFEWLGRFDNVINSGGIKLHPEKIEEKFANSIENRFFVAGIPDEKLGEKLVLIIELESKKAKDFKVFLQNRIKNLSILTKFEIPKEIYFVDAFVETATKKIQRNKTLDLVNLFKI